MTVKKLIVQLLDYNPNAEVRLSDDIGFVDEYGNEVDGSLYEIEKIREIGGGEYVELNFCNRNHYQKRKTNVR